MPDETVFSTATALQCDSPAVNLLPVTPSLTITVRSGPSLTEDIICPPVGWISRRISSPLSWAPQGPVGPRGPAHPRRSDTSYSDWDPTGGPAGKSIPEARRCAGHFWADFGPILGGPGGVQKPPFWGVPRGGPPGGPRGGPRGAPGAGAGNFRPPGFCTKIHSG